MHGLMHIAASHQLGACLSAASAAWANLSITCASMRRHGVVSDLGSLQRPLDSGPERAQWRTHPCERGRGWVFSFAIIFPNRIKRARHFCFSKIRSKGYLSFTNPVALAAATRNGS